MRTPISPGRLYNKLAAEFRAICCDRCARCILPVPTTFYHPREGATWTIGELPEDCADCAQAIAEIVRRNRAEYDLIDPLASLPSGRSRPDMRGMH